MNQEFTSSRKLTWFMNATMIDFVPLEPPQNYYSQFAHWGHPDREGGGWYNILILESILKPFWTQTQTPTLDDLDPCHATFWTPCSTPDSSLNLFPVALHIPAPQFQTSILWTPSGLCTLSPELAKSPSLVSLDMLHTPLPFHGLLGPHLHPLPYHLVSCPTICSTPHPYALLSYTRVPHAPHSYTTDILRCVTLHIRPLMYHIQ